MSIQYRIYFAYFIYYDILTNKYIFYPNYYNIFIKEGA